MIYAARFDTMNALLAFLTENCCGGLPDRPLGRNGQVRDVRPGQVSR
jgi:hypothetical protein